MMKKELCSERVDPLRGGQPSLPLSNDNLGVAPLLTLKGEREQLRARTEHTESWDTDGFPSLGAKTL